MRNDFCNQLLRQKIEYNIHTIVIINELIMKILNYHIVLYIYIYIYIYIYVYIYSIIVI